MFPMWLPALVLAGCVDLVVTHEVDLPANGVDTLRVRADRGYVDVRGVQDARLEVEVISWATAGSDTRVSQREAANDWGVWIYDDIAELWGTSRAAASGVNFVVRCPPALYTDVVLVEGGVDLLDLSGGSQVTAGNIYGRGLSGNQDLYADGDINVQILPRDGDVISLFSVRGDITLGLPDAGDYDLEVFSRDASDVQVTNLSFDSYGGEPGYFRAKTGEGRIRIQVVVERGDVFLVDADALVF